MYFKELGFQKELKKNFKYIKTRIRNLRTTHPKEYWKIINPKNKTKSQTEISLEELYDYFKELNTEKDISLPGHIFSSEQLHNISYIELNETINEPISLEKK
jgi:hypothetical protein